MADDSSGGSSGAQEGNSPETVAQIVIELASNHLKQSEKIFKLYWNTRDPPVTVKASHYRCFSFFPRATARMGEKFTFNWAAWKLKSNWSPSSGIRVATWSSDKNLTFAWVIPWAEREKHSQTQEKVWIKIAMHWTHVDHRLGCFDNNSLGQPKLAHPKTFRCRKRYAILP